MPSERFYKLSQEKQQRIVEASVDEFSEYGYSEASINRIIKDAEISRGSFYTYFADKQDLFEMLLMNFKDVAEKSIISEVQRCNGDIFATCRSLIHSALDVRVIGGKRTMRFFYRMMTDYASFSGIGSHCFFREMLDIIYDNMNDLYNSLSRSEFYMVADMLVVISVKSLIVCRQKPAERDDQLRLLFYQYDIIEKGIRGGIINE